MSTSLLDHAFGIRGYKYVRSDYPDGQVIFTIRQESKTCRCSACGSTRVQSRGHVGPHAFGPCPSGAGRRPSSYPSRASSAGPVGWCARSRSHSLTRGGPSPRRSRGAPWGCPGG